MKWVGGWQAKYDGWGEVPGTTQSSVVPTAKGSKEDEISGGKSL